MPPPTFPQPKTAAGLAARNALIVARSVEGLSHDAIAEEVSLSAEQVKKILRDYREHGEEHSLLRGDPVEIIENVLRERQTDYALYTQAAAAAAERENLNALIGALNGRGQTSDRIVKLLQDTGKLPRELGTMRYVIDFRGIAREMVRQLESLEAGKTTPAKVMGYFKEITRLGEPGAQIPEATAIEEGDGDAAVGGSGEDAAGHELDGAPKPARRKKAPAKRAGQRAASRTPKKR